jgi:hypothetical protein
MPYSLSVEPNGRKSSYGGSDLRESILDLLGEAEKPLKTSAIAARIGAKYSGRFRNVIKALRDAGGIELTNDGLYQLAGIDEPAEPADTKKTVTQR